METAKIQTLSSPVGFSMVKNSPVLEWSGPKNVSLTTKIPQKTKLIRVSSANQDHDSTIVYEASSTRSSPKPSQSQVIKLMV